jgi:F-type H+-transporting ATPase subunit epsilon
MKLLKLTIARVDMPVFDGEVVSVTVPGLSGEMTIMADHAAIITPLKTGTIVARREDGEEESILVTAGTLEVSSNHATILI